MEHRIEPDVASLREAIDEIRICFAELRVITDALAGEWGVTAAMRAVLEYLHRHGPATVPQIAKAKYHKRQSIQEIVNVLQARDLVTLRNNPAHGRSYLVAVSAQGREIFRAITEKEDVLLNALARDCGDDGKPLTAMMRRFRAVLRKHKGPRLERPD